MIFWKRFQESQEPRHKKTCRRGLQPGKTQPDLLNYRSDRIFLPQSILLPVNKMRWTSWNFAFSKCKYNTI